MSHVEKRGPGSYRVRYIAPDGKERSKTFKRKVDADRYRTHIDAAIQKGDWVDPRLGRTTFGDWIVEWTRSRINLRPATQVRDETLIRGHVLPRWGNTPLARIDHLSVRSWVADLSAEGLAPSTVQKTFQLASMASTAAVQSGLIARSPFDGTPLPKVERREMRFLDPAQVSLLAAAIDARFRDLVLFGCYGGFRIGEMLALRAGRVNPFTGEVQVLETLSEVRGRLHFGPPKTTRGTRTVQLPRQTLAGCADRISALQPEDLVFTAPEGGPVRLAAFRRRVWRPAIKAAGLEPLRIHDMRHTAVALWIATGASPNEVARRAGHTSVSTVLDRYGHLLPGTEQQVTDRLGSLLEEAEQATNTGSVRQLRPDDSASRTA